MPECPTIYSFNGRSPPLRSLSPKPPPMVFEAKPSHHASLSARRGEGDHPGGKVQCANGTVMTLDDARIAWLGWLNSQKRCSPHTLEAYAHAFRGYVGHLGGLAGGGSVRWLIFNTLPNTSWRCWS